jgi:phospholipid N-methyltransferase
MDYQALNELYIMSHAANYNNWIWKTISQYVGKNVVEIGAGIGTFTKYLIGKERVFATDIAENCINILHRYFDYNKNIIVERFDISQRPELGLWHQRAIDTLICLNVLEHIEKDVEALIHMKLIIKRGANIILMVPAFQFAYGTIDKLDGHYRRYSRNDIYSKLILAGIRPLSIYYFNSAGLLAWFYSSRLANNTSTSPSKVKIYDRYLVPLLRFFEGKVKPPFGQSLIAIGRRQ